MVRLVIAAVVRAACPRGPIGQTAGPPKQCRTMILLEALSKAAYEHQQYFPAVPVPFARRLLAFPSSCAGSWSKRYFAM